MLKIHAGKSGARMARRGAAMVEMVIALNVLMLLVFGMIDMGLMLKNSLAISHLAKNAARSYALGTDEGTIESRAKADARDLGLDLGPQDNKLEFTFDVHSDSDKPEVPILHNMEVTLTYRHSTVAGKLLGLPDEVNLKGTGVHIKE